ncbi:hypothetical protein [Hymenobacter sp.]|jgi:hypothetical protein|uniref:hypothetical protein n=1 Tax=Hymenobacter sp. TaxID=1898978 RepID=UPI002EDB5A82
MSSVAYYRALCGSLYRVTTTASTRSTPASTRQARRSLYAADFGPEYATHPEEVARLIRIGSFVPEPAPELQPPAAPITLPPASL